MFLAVAGFGIACAALVLGGRFGGPAARWLFGEPSGFQSDVTTLPALMQAGMVLLACLLFAFACLGAFLSGRRGSLTRGEAWWVANPVSMSAAFWIHFMLGNQVDWWSQLPYEYMSVVTWTLHTLVGPPIYVLVLLGGARWRPAARCLPEARPNNEMQRTKPAQATELRR